MTIENLNLQPKEPEKPLPDWLEVSQRIRSLESSGIISLEENNKKAYQQLRELSQRWTTWVEEKNPEGIEKLTGFIREHLTSSGKETLESIAQETGLNPEQDMWKITSRVTETSKLQTKPIEEPRQSTEKPAYVRLPSPIFQQEGEDNIDQSLEQALESGPSSLIDEGIIKALQRISDLPETNKLPWWTSPIIELANFRASKKEAQAKANTRQTIADTIDWLSGIAGEDAKRDALLNYIAELRNALTPYIPTYCETRGIRLPRVNTPEEMVLLLRMSAEYRAIQSQGAEITRQGEELAKMQVKLQAERAKANITKKELPDTIEAEKEANVLKEEKTRETTRHVASRFMNGISGLFMGTVGGLYEGIEKSVSNLVEKHPKTAISLGFAFGVFTYNLILSGSSLPSIEIVQAAATKGLIAGGSAAIITGIASGAWPHINRIIQEKIQRKRKTYRL